MCNNLFDSVSVTTYGKYTSQDSSSVRGKDRESGGGLFNSLKGYRTEVVGGLWLDSGLVVAAYHEHGLFFDGDGGRVADVGFEIYQRWVGAKGDDDVSVVGDYVR